MIKHIVMWTVKEGDTPRAKFERMAEMKARLMGLKEEIREIKGFEVYFNSPSTPVSNYDVILISEFDSRADLEAYQKHSEHAKVADYVNNVRETRAAIDFEI